MHRGNLARLYTPYPGNCSALGIGAPKWCKISSFHRSKGCHGSFRKQKCAKGTSRPSEANKGKPEALRLRQHMNDHRSSSKGVLDYSLHVKARQALLQECSSRRLCQTQTRSLYIPTPKVLGSPNSEPYRKS